MDNCGKIPGGSNDGNGEVSDEMNSKEAKDELSQQRDNSKEPSPNPSKRKLNEETTDGGQSVPTKSNGNNTAQESGKKAKKRKSSKKGVDPKILEVRRTVQMCCQANDLMTAMEAYQSAVEDGIRIEPQSFYNLLSLCDGLERTIHIGTPKEPPLSDTSRHDETQVNENQNERSAPSSPSKVREVCETKRLEYAFQIKQHMDNLQINLTETAYTALVRLLSRNQQLEQALEFVEAAETVQQCKPKLRLYSSLLEAFCDVNELSKALELRKRVNNIPELALTEKEYAALLRCATTTCSPIVFEGILSDLAEDVLVPSKATVSAIVDWFRSSASNKQQQGQDSDDTMCQLLEDGHSHNMKRNDSDPTMLISTEPPPCMGPVVNANGWIISESCHIDTSTGCLQDGCLKGGLLRPVPLSERSWNIMKQMNREIIFQGHVDGNSNSQFQGGKKGKLRNDFSPEMRQEQWSRFCTFLKRMEDRRQIPDVVLDGANIGYHEQNFAGAPRHVDYEQIDWIVRHFVHNLKKRVLLVMHQRHFSPKMIPDKFRYLEREWNKLGALYKTPFGMNDDWFWLHAALEYRTLVVTNDEMRDHHFQMLAPRMFLRWKERHQIHFNFGGWEYAESPYRSQQRHNEPNNRNNGRPRKSRDVQLEYPDVYSRRIQRVNDGLVVPLAKRGDTHRFLDGSHVASENEPEEETFLCVRPAAPTSSSVLSID